MVIGLEIHAQLKTNTKIFCGCKSVFGEPPNSLGCPVCLGLPGSLPVLNKRVVEMAIRAGLATNCTITNKSTFARKHYFYPDLPKGYQISQYDKPLCKNGYLTIQCHGESKKIGITRIHLEEDSGKLIHDQDVDSLLDVNRCGTALIEIVSDPDLRSAAEAYTYLTSIKQILRYLDVCDCNMEEGSLRCDANISIRHKGETALGTKTELKNMNSFRGVEKALEYEFKRQIEVVLSGGKVIQQTYLWDANKNITQPMRSKEDAHDYHYFPDPDLVPLLVEESWIREIQEKLVELPYTRCNRFIQDYGLQVEHAQVLTEDKPVADYFEETARSCKDTKLVAIWVMGEILRMIKEKKVEVYQLNMTPKRLNLLLNMIMDGAISANAAKKVLDRAEAENKEPAILIEEMGLRQISDTSSLEQIVKKILLENPAEVKRYRGNDKKLLGFFVGQAMKATKGKGNPQEINRIVSELLDQEEANNSE
jgi:aspartyl-tRNA(Asn)/glutamyl-tRNA(Gln) amidotransferase subunit B